MTEDLWNKASRELRKSLGTNNHTTWIKPLIFQGLEGGVARFGVPTTFMGDWVARNFDDQIRRQICENGGVVERLDFVVTSADRLGKPPQPKGAYRVSEPARNSVSAQATPRRAPRPSRSETFMGLRDIPGAPLDSRFTFDSFVVGKPNELAHAAARRVAEGGEVTFNPLFLYGGVGLGKTHLMHAIALELRSRSPDLKVIYLSAEQFMYRFVQALREGSTMDFKEMFRSVDVLMVDDVQFVAGKDSTQDEFFHTFNAVVDQGKQIVISGDRSPGEIDGLDERIKSRLQWGLVVDVHPTDYELRLSILHSKVDQYRASYPGLEIADGVLEYLAHRVSSNVRALEGALTRLFAFASLVGKEITLESAQDCLADLLRASDRKVTIDLIIRKVCEHFNLRRTDMLSPKRTQAIARPRQVAMYLSKQLTSRSLPEIGRSFDGRDHTTVLHAVRRIEDLMSTDSQLADDVELLRRMLEA